MIRERPLVHNKEESIYILLISIIRTKKCSIEENFYIEKKNHIFEIEIIDTKEIISVQCPLVNYCKYLQYISTENIYQVACRAFTKRFGEDKLFEALL